MTDSQIIQEVRYRILHSLGCVTKRIEDALTIAKSEFCLECIHGNLIEDLVNYLLTLEHNHRKITFIWD